MFGKNAIRVFTFAATFLQFAAHSGGASAQARFDIAAQPMDSAILAVANSAKINVLFDPKVVEGLRAPPLRKIATIHEALTQLLAGTQLRVVHVGSRTVSIVSDESPVGSIAVSADSDATPDVPNSPQSVLPVVLVTSQRREQTADTVPISISAYSQQAMDDLHLQSFGDIASVTPGLVVTTSGGNGQSLSDVAIRGIFSGGNSPTTGIYIDETPIAIRRMDAAGLSGSPHPDIFDLDRIEVLRGPQGTLFGAGAMGGAIRYITPQPDLERSSGYTKSEFGYTDHGAPSYAVGAAYGAPLIDELAAFRVSGWFHRDGGFIDEVGPYSGSSVKRNANSADTYVFRPAFTLAPVDGLSITPAVYIQHQHSDASDQYWITNLPIQTGSSHATGMGRGPTSVADDLKVYSLAVKYQTPKLEFQSDSSYLHRNSNAFDDWTGVIPTFLGGPPLIPSLGSYVPYDQDISSTRMWQQEFRASSRSSSILNWVAGFYFRKSVQELTQRISDIDPVTEALYGTDGFGLFGYPEYVDHGQRLSSLTAFSTTDEQKAVFGELSIDLTSKLKSTLGIRYEHAQVKDQREVYAGPFNGTAYAAATVPEEVDNPVTPRVSLTYQFSDGKMAYVTAAKGYRPGGTNAAAITTDVVCQPSAEKLGLSSVPETYNSDSLWSYELGTKLAMFDRRVALEASLYYINWVNVQSTLNLISCGQTITVNQGKAISQGFDVQLSFIPIDGMKINANAGYVDAYFPNAMYADPQDGTFPVHLAGDKIPGSIPWTASVHGEYAWQASSLLRGMKPYLRADFRWLDRIHNINPLIPNYDGALGLVTSDAYKQVNLRVGILGGGVDVSAFVNNATNSDPRLAFTHLGIYSATAIRPLTAGLTAIYRF